jgi:hypothetical protein
MLNNLPIKVQQILHPYCNSKITIADRAIILSSIYNNINQSQLISITHKKNIYVALDNIFDNSGLTNISFGDILPKSNIESIEHVFPPRATCLSIDQLLNICRKDIKNDLIHPLFNV